MALLSGRRQKLETQPCPQEGHGSEATLRASRTAPRIGAAALGSGHETMAVLAWDFAL